MTDAPEKSDVVKKKLTPEDNEFLVDWVKHHGLALTELAEHFCRFPGNVEVSLTLKMRSMGGGQFSFTFGDITASHKEIEKAFAQHEARKEAKWVLH
jgi:hypothetical protein